MDVFDRRRTRLRELLTEISQADLSRKSGVAASYISRCMKERSDDGFKTIGEVTARKLEAGAHKPEGWLDEREMTGAEYLAERSLKRPARGNSDAINITNNPDYPAIRRVALKAQAGVTGYAVEFIDEDGPPIVFRRDWYAMHNYQPERLIALRVSGESMVPSLYQGDLIVANTSSAEPKDGIAFVVAYEGEIAVKRLVRDDGLWWLSSDNADQRRYPRKKCNGDTQIIGEVVYRQTERI
jgi:phage repressor protein C with HTH and peptisase S24 domain